MSFEQAYEAVREYCVQIRTVGSGKPPQTEEVPLLQALGRVLAEPVLADRDFPPFPRATRDGYALRAADLMTMPATLRVVGQVRAGDSYDLPVLPGEAVEIMTGAAVPEGADTVVMVEHTALKSVEQESKQKTGEASDSSSAKNEDQSIENAAGDKNDDGLSDILDLVSEDDGIDDILEAITDSKVVDSSGNSGQKAKEPADEYVEIQKSLIAGENIVPVGAEAKAGQEMLSPGLRLGPAQIAMAAAAGKAHIRVYRRPRVAILSTGDELVEVAESPGPHQIRNSNSYSLAALVIAWGGEPEQLPLAPDEAGKLTALVKAGLAADMLLLSGGVSMGKFDLVEQALKSVGAEFFFTGVLIQPGKPVVFGEVKTENETKSSEENKTQADASRHGEPQSLDHAETAFGKKIPLFGFPGNPVSVMVTFDLFARPVLQALGGAVPVRLSTAKARLRKDFKAKTGLTRFIPAILEGGLSDPEVEAIAWQGSGDLLASARANCYLVVPPDRAQLAAGEMVSVVVR